MLFMVICAIILFTMKYRDEASIRAFQEVMAAKYASGEVDEAVEADGAKVGVITDGSFRMVDTYFSNEADQNEADYDASFNGRTVISVADVPVWLASYDTRITDPKALDFYYNGVMGNPSPDMPLFGEQGLVDSEGRLEYTFTPLLGSKLVIGRYAVEEAMRDLGTGENVYLGHSSGGWLT